MFDLIRSPCGSGSSIKMLLRATILCHLPQVAQRGGLRGAGVAHRERRLRYAFDPVSDQVEEQTEHVSSYV